MHIIIVLMYVQMQLIFAANSLPYPNGINLSTKLIFTNYIKENKLLEARQNSEVKGLPFDIKSYSGFFNVDEKCDSFIYIWFFPSQTDPAHDPVTLWLQGGPGSSSLFGLFHEIGPYNLTKDGVVQLREFPWYHKSSVIFMDNPVGTGFSSTRDCYASNQDDVGRYAVEALEQFFKIFIEYADNDFFIAGESFAGHYIPGVAYTIHNAKSKINLKGIAIGNGLVDPINQLRYSEYLYNLGYIDYKTRKKLEILEESVRNKIKNGQYEAATETRYGIFDEIGKVTGFEELFNYLYPHRVPPDGYRRFVTSSLVREAIHVGQQVFGSREAKEKIGRSLYKDVTFSYRPYLQILLNHYRVLLYEGQFDILEPYPLAQEYINKLKWNHSQNFFSAKRRTWYVGNDLVGYIKSAGNLTDILIRNAGHLVPMDQPKVAFLMYKRFIFNEKIDA